MVHQIGSLSNPSELCSDHFPSRFCQPGVLNKDPTVWLDGARPPPISLIYNSIEQRKLDAGKQLS
jgi:hypothetical protein